MATSEEGSLAINFLVDSSGLVRLRPAIVSTELAVTAQGTPIGMYVWRSVFDRREYLVYVTRDRKIWAADLVTLVTTALSDATVATQLDGSATQVVFAEDSQRLVMAGGGQLQIWTGTGLTSRIAGTTVGVNEPPLSATHVVSLTNYLIANEIALPGQMNQIFWSGLGDGNHLTWSPLNFNTADADPDPIIAIGANLREVFAFGTRTVQSFGPGADPNLPFAASSSLALGCGAAYSVIRRDDDFALLDASRRFVVTDARAYEEIGHDVSQIVRAYTTVTDCFGFRLRVAYWDLLVWVFPTEGKALAYDQALKRWFQWRGWNGADDYAAIRIGCYAPWHAGNLHIVGDPQAANIWTLDPTTASDQGPALPLVAERVPDRTDWGTPGRKRCTKVRAYCKRGTSDDPGLLDVAKRDDDGPWGGSQLLSLGASGDQASFVDWYPGGIYRRRQYRVRCSSGVDIAIYRFVEFWEPLGD